jgi:hypothetical protein
MRTPKFVLALPVLLALAATAGFWSQRGPSQQDTRVAEPSLHVLASYGPTVRTLLPGVRADELTTASGRRLGCDEIRSIDEVELISDDSYCTEHS